MIPSLPVRFIPNLVAVRFHSQQADRPCMEEYNPNVEVEALRIPGARVTLMDASPPYLFVTQD